MNKRFSWIILSVFVIEIFLLLKVQFTAWPEMLAWPYLNIHGWQYYRDIAVAHTPFMLSTLSAYYGVFGVGVLQLKIFTWILIAVMGILIYFFAAKLLDRKVATLTLVLFFAWQMFYEGNGLWFDLFMGAFAFVSFYLIQRKRYLWAGVFWALAFVSKQTAVWFLIPIVITTFGHWRQFLMGALITSALFFVAMSVTGDLPSFYNWAFKFGVVTLPNSVGQIQLPDLKNLAIASFPFTIFIPWFFAKDKKRMTLWLWALAGVAGAYPRFEYFHFQPAIPYLALASAEVFTGAWDKKDWIKAFVPVYVIGSLYLLSGFFVRNWNQGTRFYETSVSDVVFYVKNNTHEADRIFVMNWWDSIYALSDRLPATDPLVPQLSWYQEAPTIQDKEVADLAKYKPKLIILNEYSVTGLSSYVPQKVNEYVQDNYVLKEKFGAVDILMQK